MTEEIDDEDTYELPDFIKEKVRYPSDFTENTSSEFENSFEKQKQEQGIIFFIHGGGFMANFCSSDLRYLAQWAELTHSIIIEVDYSLMPFRIPRALQECFLAYKYIAEGRLGFNVRRIAVVGDSSGFYCFFF